MTDKTLSKKLYDKLSKKIFNESSKPQYIYFDSIEEARRFKARLKFFKLVDRK